MVISTLDTLSISLSEILFSLLQKKAKLVLVPISLAVQLYMCRLQDAKQCVNNGCLPNDDLIDRIGQATFDLTWGYWQED